MKHVGSITEIHGYDLEPVDCITFGSPRQDLSVAGRRAGLDGERSGLFMDAVRIIKEMREHELEKLRRSGRTDEPVRPRFAIWENVAGAFSSNKGEDFRVVLEELARIREPGFSIPRCDKRWLKSGCIVGDDWSIAWRLEDAQYWGVPQRRKRISLVMDIGGRCAGEISFESEGLPGYPPQSIEPWKGIATNPQNGIRTAGWIVLNDQGGNRMDITDDVTCTLRAESHHPPIILEDAIPVENHPQDSRITLSEDGKVQTLTSRMGTGGGNVPIMLKVRSGVEIDSKGKRAGKGALISEDKAMTLAVSQDQYLFQPVPPFAYGISSDGSNSMKSDNPHSGIYLAESSRTLDLNGGNPACNQGGIVVIEGNGQRASHKGDGYKESETMYTLNTIEQHGVAYGVSNEPYCWGHGVRDAKFDNSGITDTLTATDYKDPPSVCLPAHPAITASKASFFTLASEELADTLVATDYKDPPIVTDYEEPYYIARRLTPLECERLQGFPDNWTLIPDFEYINAKGKTMKGKAADNKRYKALGNSIALPQWWWLVNKMKPYLPERPLLGSLFDGIGGFPLVWETAYGTGTARWASEIDPFPIAVTKYHFPEE